MRLIGQERFKTYVKSCKKPPLLLILVGSRGSGKTEFAKWAAKEWDFQECIILNNTKDTILKVITELHSIIHPIAIVFENVDKASKEAFNALLKLTEEPPAYVHIVITAEVAEYILPNILSRGTLYNLEPYTSEEITEYAKRDETLDLLSLKYIPDICNTPGEVNELIKINIPKFWTFVHALISGLPRMSGVDLFKISSQIKFKDENSGYDVLLFLRMFMKVVYNDVFISMSKVDVELIEAAAKCLDILQRGRVNKKAAFDMFLLEIRAISRERNNA